MKIGLQTWGTAGDVRPFIALAGGLSAAGHEVTLAYTDVDNKQYDEWARLGGFRIIQVGHVDPGDEGLRSRIVRSMNPLRQWELVMANCLDPLDEEIYRAACALCESNDVVVGHGLVHHLQVAAEKKGVPYAGVMLQTNAATSRFSAPGGFPNLGPWLNPLMWKGAQLMVDRVLKVRFNKLRHKEGLPPIAHALDGPVPRHPHLHAYSPALGAPPRDWSPLHQVCGFLEVPMHLESWQLPADLSAFLQAGEAPVFLGFGSPNGVESSFGTVAETTRLLVDAVRRAGCRAIVQAPWSTLGDIPDHPDIYRLEQGPHGALFPHCSLVVHHGGAGTTHTAVRAGCPSVVVAHWLDQIVWALRLWELGLARRPLLRRKLKVEKLAQEIRSVQADPRFRERAAEVAAAMRTENGVKTAVATIESWFRQPLAPAHSSPRPAAGFETAVFPIPTAVGH